jgi:DNA repair exonuclease SbcCD ATPase subunit
VCTLGGCPLRIDDDGVDASYSGSQTARGAPPGAEDEVAQEALRVIEIRQELLAHLSDAFKGYREWLYRNKLGPLIQEAVNELLVNICDGRPLSLEPEWLPAIDTFSWFLRDGVSRTIIEKASGFQRFITGMAMRVAMSRLGIAGQTLYENLIIDEGFTACDGENLEKVPAFLKALIADQKYKGVVLATHLEELKACGDKQISIERDGISGISALRAGPVRIVLSSVVEKAKRGKKKVGGV